MPPSDIHQGSQQYRGPGPAWPPPSSCGLALVGKLWVGLITAECMTRQPSPSPDASALLYGSQNMSSLFFHRLKASDVLTDITPTARTSALHSSL